MKSPTENLLKHFLAQLEAKLQFVSTLNLNIRVIDVDSEIHMLLDRITLNSIIKGLSSGSYCR